MPPDQLREDHQDDESDSTSRQPYTPPAVLWQEDLAGAVHELDFACGKSGGMDPPCVAAPAS